MLSSVEKWEKMFSREKSIIGMVHTLPSPGTPLFKDNIPEIIEKAVSEAIIYQEFGFDGIIIENMHDVPYMNRKIGAEVVSIMSVIATKIRAKIEIPIGIQILAGGNKEALAVAKVANLDFIRAEGFIFSHIADEGFMDSCAGELLRYRKQIDADNIAIFTDIKKKHSSHAITDDVNIHEFAKTAEFFLSDGIIITGDSTAKPASIKELQELEDIKIPKLIGSGITDQNIDEYFKFADAFIIGSYFKEQGLWKNDISKERLTNFMAKIEKLRNCEGIKYSK